MKITHNTPDLLILRFTRWQGPLFHAACSLVAIGAAALLVSVAHVPTWVLLVWLAASAGFSIPYALYRVEKSMLVLNATTGKAELRHRDIWGMHIHIWPLHEVQSTRATRYSRHGPAEGDPNRLIALYVRDGMDEGRHTIAKHTVPAGDALDASAKVSDWMKAWSTSVDPSVDSGGAKP